MKLLLLLFLSYRAAACPSKKVALNCFYEKADHNHDGFVSKNELSHAIDARLYFWQRPLFHAFGGVSRILKDCDLNKDNKLTQSEAKVMKGCMDTCYKRKKTVDLFECKHS